MIQKNIIIIGLCFTIFSYSIKCLGFFESSSDSWVMRSQDFLLKVTLIVVLYHSLYTFHTNGLKTSQSKIMEIKVMLTFEFEFWSNNFANSIFPIFSKDARMSAIIVLNLRFDMKKPLNYIALEIEVMIVDFPKVFMDDSIMPSIVGIKHTH